MNPARGFVSCDWGTSNLRLRWVDAEDGRIAGEVSSAEGVRYAFDQARSGRTRSEAYAGILARNLERLETVVGRSLAASLVMISGMASSSIGMAELPYAPLPFPLRGEGLVYRILDDPLPAGQRVVLLSGVRSADDVMRGEETQLIGLHSRLEPVDEPVLYILPGTHSKHATVANSALLDFHSFLTGELFEAVIAHTVLRGSVESPGQGDFSRSAFQDGVRAAADGSLLNALFLGRTNTLFTRLEPAANYWFLSGVLIGAELGPLRGGSHRRIRLCAGSPLRPLYQAAIEALGLGDRTAIVSAELVDESAAWGQLTLYRRLIAGRGEAAPAS